MKRTNKGNHEQGLIRTMLLRNRPRLAFGMMQDGQPHLPTLQHTPRLHRPGCDMTTGVLWGHLLHLLLRWPQLRPLSLFCLLLCRCPQLDLLCTTPQKSQPRVSITLKVDIKWKPAFMRRQHSSPKDRSIRRLSQQVSPRVSPKKKQKERPYLYPVAVAVAVAIAVASI